MKSIALIGFLFLIGNEVVAQSDCFCGSTGVQYTSNHDEWVMELPWAVESIQREKGLCVIDVELLGDGDERLETGDLEIHFSSIFWEGRWWPFSEFEAEIRKRGCQTPPLS
jgi:hypothetical protein